MITILIDGDVLVYKIGFACEKKIKDEEGDISYEVEPVSHAYYLLKKTITRIEDEVATKFNDFVGSYIYLTSEDKSNFRFKVATTQPYKGNRKNFKKPELYNDIRNYLIKKYKPEVIVGMEADDALGIDQIKESSYPDTTIIASIDKDLMQIPGWHYNIDWEKLGVEPFEYVEDPGYLKLIKKGKKYVLKGGGLYWFYAQMLLGDTADNIPGVPGLGPKKTYDLLKDCKDKKEMLFKVGEIYKHNFPDNYKERYEEISKLLWIRRK